MSQTQRRAEIAGAGFGGLATAIALAQRGWQVRVHERGDKLRTTGAGIYIYENGLRVFEALGVFDDVIAGAFRGSIRELRDSKNEVLSRIEWPDDGPMRMYSIVRQDCIDSLGRGAVRAGVDIALNSEVTGASADGQLMLAGGKTIQADLIVGADGVNSAVRDSLSLVKSNVRLNDSCIRALMPRTSEEKTSGDGQKYYEYLSTGRRRILYTPCSDDQLYIALCMPRADAPGKQVPVDVESWTRAFPHLEPLFKRFDDRGRLDDFSEIKLKSWSRGKVAILGDAANAMPPNIGQGAGTAMMNGLSLAVYLDKVGKVPDALVEWEKQERGLTEHTQRISRVYALPTQWPPWLSQTTFRLAHRWPWVNKQRIKTASHIPLGTQPGD